MISLKFRRDTKTNRQSCCGSTAYGGQHTLPKLYLILGFLRRLKSRLGPAKAITATAHKIAKIIYNMLSRGVGYEEAGEAYYEEQYQGRVLKNLKRKAAELGFELVEKEPAIA